MVHDTLKLSGVILLRISVPSCASGSEGKEYGQRERDIVRGSSRFLQNVAIDPVKVSIPPNIFRKLVY